MLYCQNKYYNQKNNKAKIKNWEKNGINYKINNKSLFKKII